jgi:predicted PurR-regulated permease PerM
MKTEQGNSMDNEHSSADYDPRFVRNMIESTLRIGLLALLMTVSYQIIRPFTLPILWGAIIAIAAFPLVRWLEPILGGRRGLAAVLVTLSFLLILVIPAWSVTEASIGGVKYLSAALERGDLKVPPPSARVEEWPVIGKSLYSAWSNASSDLEAFVLARAYQIKELSGFVLKRLGNSLLGVLIFVISILIAGGFMTFADSCGTAAKRFFIRVGGLNPGGEWAPLVVATVRSVLLGVVGVAVIQTTLIAIGLFVAGIPGAPLWSAIILVLAVAQLPPLLVVAPVTIYVWSTADTTTAVIFTVYQLLAGASDNILKPLLMGRGVDIPMPVILIGAIGGMIMSGITGLFIGAVILSIMYKLIGMWLAQEAHDDSPAASAQEGNIRAPG